jgi:hypothetical protein
LFDIVDNEVDDSLDKKSIFSIFIGCTISAPDGSSPRGYSRIFSSIGSKDIVFSSFLLLLLLLLRLLLLLIFIFISLGARPALPMGVAPEAIRGGCLQPFIGSKNQISSSHSFSFPIETS